MADADAPLPPPLFEAAMVIVVGFFAAVLVGFAIHG